MAKLTLTARILPNGQPFTVNGRDCWALTELIKAGPRGCTPIDHPGPRWSGYVFKLKRNHGLNIETHHESHHGEFPGNHARYVLMSSVEIIIRSDQSERRAA